MARTAQRRAARLAYSISRLARESDISRSMIYEEIATGPPDRPQDWSAYHRTGRRAWVVAVTATAFPTEHDVAPTDETLTEGNRIIAAIGRDEGAPNSVELAADIEAQAIHATLLRSVRTQVSSAMAQFGIRYIAGYSSEARGRFERASEHSGTACPRCWPWPASLQCKTSKRIVTNRNIYSINYICCIYYISFH